MRSISALSGKTAGGAPSSAWRWTSQRRWTASISSRRSGRFSCMSRNSASINPCRCISETAAPAIAAAVAPPCAMSCPSGRHAGQKPSTRRSSSAENSEATSAAS
jgi:hypothetical protein